MVSIPPAIQYIHVFVLGLVSVPPAKHTFAHTFMCLCISVPHYTVCPADRDTLFEHIWDQARVVCAFGPCFGPENNYF